MNAESAGKNRQSPTQKMPMAFFAPDLAGSRQQAAGSRQQAIIHFF